MMSVAIYGLQDDVLANKGKNVQLYIPGQTKLTAQDIFLGGPGTGVTDEMIGSATRVHGESPEDTAYGLEQYLNSIENGTSMNAAPDQPDSSSSRTFGLQADVDANKGRSVNLYVPGKTQLSARDVFLGGTGTGVTDEQLNGAQRIFGQDAVGTRQAYNEYSGDLSSQTRAAIAQNAAPRVDSDRGIPTLARQQMEINQAKDMVDLPVKTSVATGKYLGMDTLEQKKYDEKLRQDALDDEWKQKNFDYSMSKDTLDNKYKYDALNSGNYSDAESRKISQQNANVNELNVTGEWPSSGGGASSGEYSSSINKYAQQYGVSPGLISAVINQESGGNPSAISSAGASGIMQLMPGTARELGVTDTSSVDQNIMGGTKYLSQQLQKYGNNELALAAYNAGPGAVDNAISKAGSRNWSDVSKYLTSETQNYVPSILGNVKIAPLKTKALKPSEVSGQDAKIAQNQAIALVDSMDAQGKGEDEILNYFRSNASIFANKGVDLLDIGDYTKRRRYPGFDPTSR